MTERCKTVGELVDELLTMDQNALIISRAIDAAKERGVRVVPVLIDANDDTWVTEYTKKEAEEKGILVENAVFVAW